VQLLWLLDDNPRLNWTLPVPHEFNFAGWWHAIYFVVVASVMSLLFGVLLVRLAGAVRDGKDTHHVECLLRSVGASVVLACVVTYVALAIRDSSSPALASKASLVGLGCTVVVFVLVTSILKRSVLLLGRAAISAGLVAIGMIFVVEAPWSTEPTAILGVAVSAAIATGVALLPLVPGRDMRLIHPARPGHAVVMGAILLLILPSTWLWTSEAIQNQRWFEAATWFATYLSTMIFTPLIALRAEYARWLFLAADVLLLFAVFTLLSLSAVIIPLWRYPDAVLVLILLGFGLLVWILSSRLWSRFAAVVSEEQGRSRAEESDGSAKNETVHAAPILGLLVISGLAALLALLSCVFSVYAKVEYVTDADRQSQSAPLLAQGLVFIIFAAALWLAKSRASGRAARLLRYGGAVVVAPWPLLLLADGSISFTLELISIVRIIGALLLGAWTLNSIICTTTLLQGFRVDLPGSLAAAALAISGVASGYFAVTKALALNPSQAFTWTSGMMTAIAVVAIHGSLCVNAGSLAAPLITGR
jgi:hypothetical protein